MQDLCHHPYLWVCHRNEEDSASKHVYAPRQVANHDCKRGCRELSISTYTSVSLPIPIPLPTPIRDVYCTDVRMHNTPPHMYKGVHRYVYIPQHRPDSLNRPRILQQSCEDDISIGSEFSRNLQPQIAAAVHGRSRKKLAESNQESLAWLLWVRGTMRSTRQS